MDKLKDYIKTLLKLAIQNNPEVLKVVRNAKVENDADFEKKHPRDEEGKFTAKGARRGNKTIKDLTEGEKQELGKSLYLLNKEAKAYRDAREEVKNILFENYFNGNEKSKKIITEQLKDLEYITITDEGLVSNYGDEEKTSLDDITEDINYFENEIRAAEQTLEDDDSDEDDIKSAEEDLEYWTKEKEKAEKAYENYEEATSRLHDFLSESYDEMSALYDIKDELIKTLELEAVDKHRFKDGKVRELFQIGDFSFHGKDDEEAKYEGQEIKELDTISSEIKIDSTDFSLDKALAIIKKYLPVKENFAPSIQNEKWVSIKKGDEVVHLPLDGNNKIDTKRIEQWKGAERGIKQELGDKVKKVEVEEPKDVDKKEKDFTVKKETQKAVLLSKDGVEFWTPKRFYKDGELTPAGKEIYEKARSLKDTTDELEKNGVEFEPSWESEKAYGVDTYFEDYNGKLKPVRVFIPKSQIMKNGNIPLWLFKKKIEELNEKVGFAANKGDYGSGFKTDFYKGKIVTNSKETVYTILDGELYEFEAEDFNPNMNKHKIDNDKWITIHPNGEDSKGRPLLLKDGETPKEAIERTYKKEELTEENKKYTWQDQKYSLQDLVDAGFEPIKYTSSIYKDDPLTYLAKEEGKKYYRMPLTESEYQDALKAKENKKANALQKAKKASKDLIDYVKWQYNEDIEPYITRKEGDKTIVDWYDLPRGAKSALQQIQRGGRLVLDMYSGREMSIEIKDKKILENLQRHRANNNKEQNMALLNELKKLITKVENDKGEDMDEKEKIKNEKVDKRKLIDEVAGIMKSAGADDEKIRTAIAKMEKLAYDKSEAGTADNACDDEDKVKNKKVKNEDEEDEKKYKDLKKDVKEDVENKCKNSVDNAKGGYFDKMNEIYNAATQPAEENTYISREQKLKYAEEYFSK